MPAATAAPSKATAKHSESSSSNGEEKSSHERRPAPRSIWKGAISFGMVTIPVSMFSATRSLDVSFNQLHSVCNNRINYKKWCAHCDREVAPDEIVRAYQYAKNQYVIMTDEDFENIERPSSHTLSLMSFVQAEEIDPVYFEKS